MFGGPAGPADSDDDDGLKTGTQIRSVKRIAAHPASRYSSGFTASDLALVELLEPFEFGDLVDGACLADDDAEVQDEQLCITAGWSSDDKDGRKSIIWSLSAYISRDFTYHFSGPGFLQYVSYLPEAAFLLSECNATEHYNGLLDDADICSGARVGLDHCRVS